jgi:hypothetical protein
MILPSGEEYIDSTGKSTRLLENAVQVETYLKRKAKLDRDAAGPANQDKPLRSLIILRVHQKCIWDKTYAILKACRLAGYHRVQLRAEITSGP